MSSRAKREKYRKAGVTQRRTDAVSAAVCPSCRRMRAGSTQIAEPRSAGASRAEDVPDAEERVHEPREVVLHRPVVDGVVVVALAGEEPPREPGVQALVVVEGLVAEADEPERERGGEDARVGDDLAIEDAGSYSAQLTEPTRARQVPAPVGGTTEPGSSVIARLPPYVPGAGHG